MFIGHFGIALGAKRLAARTSLGTLILAAQLPDILWPVLLLPGTEHVDIAPGITKVSPLDFYDYPISHSLVLVFIWAVLAGESTLPGDTTDGRCQVRNKRGGCFRWMHADNELRSLVRTCDRGVGSISFAIDLYRHRACRLADNDHRGANPHQCDEGEGRRNLLIPGLCGTLPVRRGTFRPRVACQPNLAPVRGSARLNQESFD